MSEQAPPDWPGGQPEDELGAVYGEQSAETVFQGFRLKTDFAPWHHPVKQVVRDHQWRALAERLLRKERGDESVPVLRYFTLPGVDLMDIRALAAACQPLGTQIEFFGFNDAVTAGQESDSQAILRQAGLITPGSNIMEGKLEDIALESSLAAARLKNCQPFDVINIDACDHLGYRPSATSRCTFDAIRSLLEHQMEAQKSWLLFITTRTAPHLLGEPTLAFQLAINKNLEISPEEFGQELAQAIEADPKLIVSDLTSTWGSPGHRFLKLYSIGVGKFLLQFFHGQPSRSTRVELASVYSYRVHGNEPDMLAMAFRITPGKRRVFGPGVGGAVSVPMLEPQEAVQVAKNARKLQDLDAEMEKDPELFKSAVTGTQSLLAECAYDLTAWERWLANHPIRPLKMPEGAAAA